MKKVNAKRYWNRKPCFRDDKCFWKKIFIFNIFYILFKKCDTFAQSLLTNWKFFGKILKWFCKKMLDFWSNSKMSSFKIDLALYWMMLILGMFLKWFKNRYWKLLLAIARMTFLYKKKQKLSLQKCQCIWHFLRGNFTHYGQSRKPLKLCLLLEFCINFTAPALPNLDCNFLRQSECYWKYTRKKLRSLSLQKRENIVVDYLAEQSLQD